MKHLYAVLAVLGSFFAGAAHAALPEGVQTALSAVQADATSLFGIVVPIVIAILGMALTIKLIKRFANKI